MFIEGKLHEVPLQRADVVRIIGKLQKGKSEAKINLIIAKGISKFELTSEYLGKIALPESCSSEEVKVLSFENIDIYRFTEEKGWICRPLFSPMPLHRYGKRMLPRTCVQKKPTN